MAMQCGGKKQSRGLEGDERAYGMEEHRRKQQSQLKVPYVRRPPWVFKRGSPMKFVRGRGDYSKAA